MRYKKKPVIIDAVQWTGNNIEELKEFMNTASHEYDSINNSLNIKTLEGTMHAEVDDYIIKGVKGEFYPCKPDIFEATYEAIE